METFEIYQLPLTACQLPLTGDAIRDKLTQPTLISGNDLAATINANKVSALAETEADDDNLTLATKGYVDEKVGTGGGGGTASLESLGITASVEDINSIAAAPTPENEGQFLRVVEGKATWVTIASAEEATF